MDMLYRVGQAYPDAHITAIGLKILGNSGSLAMYIELAAHKLSEIDFTRAPIIKWIKRIDNNYLDNVP